MNNNQSHTTNRHSQTTGQSDPARPFHYFVAIMSMEPRGLRTMQVEVHLSRRITTMDEVKDVQEWARTTHHLSNPMIIGFTLLRNDLADRRRTRS
ncbi:hypothetical protein [Couchioplanes caeruleus]|uniref:Uncharacterized protein n=2 Tax=Couchioplanes caeruleus TaxID=56438 RepID=A0A1K0FKA5_9ACTN|nr:hypothetical protein [Couchioplanes caeruleus]OJF13303.1 hypothetical protein BG844_15940 [Couchioplanes caeruleus subsp. caeruleus]ROP33502.1 hypothetical protein EDD30_6489 [Couchioplanes caeruleus]